MSSRGSQHYRRRSIEREREVTNLEKFSFLKFRIYFDKLVASSHRKDTIIEDVPDFWSFVRKYEGVLKQKGQPILSDPIIYKDGETSITPEYQKRLCIFIDIATSLRSLMNKCDGYRNENELSDYKVKQFMEVVLLYLDFKQKERFTKLTNLRKSQKSLPMYKEKQTILENLKKSEVLIIAGDTGCGKSTQLPQYLYEYGHRNIVCTQPRRLACISLSKRVAHEMLADYGTKVGYQIRFEKKRTKLTDICFITEGLLLRQVAVDPDLRGCEVLILDEVHERNLQTDILLGMVKCLLRRNAKMKVVLMSATLHTDLFKNFFEHDIVSLVKVPGRLYPIDVHYIPPPVTEFNRGRVSSKDKLSPEPYIQILSMIDQKYPRNERGDVLIFMSGVHEIQVIIDAAKEYSERENNWIILPLHSGLSLVEQDKVFDYAPEGMRKCIVSTNIAETSITVDGVRFVIDSGKMKEMSYDAACKMQKLKEYWISKSSAEQRKGRAGRTGPGVCYRLYSKKDYENMPDYMTPEVHRVPLDSMLLQMIAMGLSNVRLFPFIESPTNENIEKAIVSLQQHEAITTDEKITSLGKALSTLPVDISIGKMLLMGCVFEQLQQVLTLAAVLSVQSPFTQRAFQDPKCERERKEFESSHGEPLTLLNVYKEWLEMKWSKHENTRVWCRRIGIEEQRFYELTKLRNQFQNILENFKIVKEDNSVGLSSAERTIRHGEVKALRAIKRTHEFEAPKARKILKLGDNDSNLDESQDIRDVEFRLSHDSSKFKALMSSANASSHGDVLILKLLIVSGLYPQIAIPDEFNTIKNDQFFHTFSKPFVLLHPNGQFANNADLLKLTSADIMRECGSYSSKLPISSKHQVLCYQSLLETTKPYLLNTIRMPTAQTLLLFASSIDTNRTASKIVFDSWLCLEFPTPETGQTLLYEAIRIRTLWNKMLNNKLKEMELVEDVVKVSISDEEQNDLFVDLISFMNREIIYTVKRLLPADLKEIYTHVSDDEERPPFNPFQENYSISPNETKGGFNVTNNVVYASIRETQWSMIMEDEIKDAKWTCNKCSEEVSVLGIMKILHMSQCATANKLDMKNNDIQNPSKPPSKSKNLASFSCNNCGQTLEMTPIEILRHKRKCGASKRENKQVDGSSF